MNPLNYATLEASQRLVDAGIVLKTKKYWYYSHLYGGWSKVEMAECDKKIPRPQMAEVWRELREYVLADISLLRNVCPALLLDKTIDDLIDLLIWVIDQVHTCNTCANGFEGTCTECAGDNYGHTTEISGKGTCSNWVIEKRKEKK